MESFDLTGIATMGVWIYSEIGGLRESYCVAVGLCWSSVWSSEENVEQLYAYPKEEQQNEEDVSCERATAVSVLDKRRE